MRLSALVPSLAIVVFLPAVPAISQVLPTLPRAATEAAATTGINPPADFIDIPAPEISLSGGLPATTSTDTQTASIGLPDNRLVVLIKEDFELHALRSTDGGTTFGPETMVAGGSGQGLVRMFQALGTPAGEILVLLEVSDPDGGRGLQFVRSPDMGLTWSAPTTLVDRTGPPFAPSFSRIAARGGKVAVLTFSAWVAGHPYVLASTDSGASWTKPVRVDPVAPDYSDHYLGDIAIDAGGVIHVAHAQDRLGENLFFSIWYTRSADNGQTFAPEQNMDFVYPPGEPGASLLPTLATANDGGILLAFHDADFGRLYSVRSTNGGVSFQKILQEDGVYGTYATNVRTEPGTATVLLLTTPSTGGTVMVRRSSNQGAAFGTPQILSTTGAGSYYDGMAGVTRTQAARWAIGWTDTRNGASDIYLSESNDEGVSWSPAMRVDTDALGSAASVHWFSGLTSVGTDRLFLSYPDERGQHGGTYDVYSNWSAAGALDFSLHERRIDVDRAKVNPGTDSFPAVTSDGADHVYVAMRATTTGSYGDIYLAISDDGGHHFGAATRVGGPQAADRNNSTPLLKALPDGRVYLVYLRREPSVGYQLRFNRSVDFGATWLLENDAILQTNSRSPSDLQLEATPGGRVYVSWSDRQSVFLARSADSGETFAVEDVDQDPFNYSAAFPRLCAQGDEVFLVCSAHTNIGSYYVPWAIRSADGGQTWDARVQLGDATDSLRANQVACAGSGRASAFWSGATAPGSFYSYLATRAYRDGTWSPEVLIDSPPNPSHNSPMAVFTDPSTLIVAYVNVDWSPDFAERAGLFAVRSIDGGLSFGGRTRLNEVSPVPSAFVGFPHLVQDGAQNVWAEWLDRGAGGLDSVVARLSNDGGATWGPVRRVNRETPQSSRGNYSYSRDGAVTATAGTAFFVWSGERASYLRDTLVNAWSVGDLDRDGAAAESDCNDGDAAVWGLPGEAGNVRVEKAGAQTHVAWQSQDASAGPGTSYDLVTGAVVDLHTASHFGAATCLANDEADQPFADPRLDPGPGQGYYYLVRAQNGCGTGTYGDSSLTSDPRDALDAGGPCP